MAWMHQFYPVCPNRVATAQFLSHECEFCECQLDSSTLCIRDPIATGTGVCMALVLCLLVMYAKNQFAIIENKSRIGNYGSISHEKMSTGMYINIGILCGAQAKFCNVGLMA